MFYSTWVSYQQRISDTRYYSYPSLAGWNGKQGVLPAALLSPLESPGVSSAASIISQAPFSAFFGSCRALTLCSHRNSKLA